MEPVTRREQFYSAIAGETPTPEPITREEMYLKKIADKVILPEVSADDNGDVLSVVDGAWGKATPSGGGGGIFVVTTGMGDEPNTFANANHNATEIMEALENNQLPVLFFHMELGGEKHTTPANYKTIGGGGGNPWHVIFTIGTGDDVRVNDDYSVEFVNS